MKRKTLFISIISVATGLAVAIAAAVIPIEKECDNIRSSVFRLHIIANSDSYEDQAVKLKVRDAIISKSEEIFKGLSCKEEAINAAKENLDVFKSVAENTLAENGFITSADVTVGNAWFSTREYEDFTLPAGDYQALKIVIGEGKGKNWWCVMFPSVCLPSATASIGDALNEKETEIVTEKNKYKPAFLIIELWEKFIKNF